MPYIQAGGNLAIYLRPLARDGSILLREVAARRGPLEHLSCLRCHRELETGHKSVGVFMFAQTVGIRPRQKSAARRMCFCSPCSVSLAMGPTPDGALNIAAWQMIRDLVGSDPALNQAAWETLRGIVGLLQTSEAGADSVGQPVNAVDSSSAGGSGALRIVENGPERVRCG
jgi:hypothetical protein